MAAGSGCSNGGRPVPEKNKNFLKPFCSTHSIPLLLKGPKPANRAETPSPAPLPVNPPGIACPPWKPARRGASNNTTNEVLSRGNMSSKLSALAEVDATGAFVRSASKFTNRIGSAQFPAAAGRYMLYVSLACPWACRTLALRALKGLEDVVPVTVVAPRWARTKPLQDEHMGWVFKSCAHPGDADLAEVPWTEPVFQANSIRAVYEAAAPDVQHVKASSYVLEFNAL
jgi:hypothetical protein